MGGARGQEFRDDQGGETAHECLGDSTLLRLAQGSLEPEEVEVLLQRAGDCSECWALLSEVGREFEEHGADDSENGEPLRRTGALIADRYRLIRRVGRGGMGEVFEAWDLELEQGVALKMVREGAFSSAETYARLKREVSLARQVAHPNVCRVFDWGRQAPEEGGASFLTMELLEGESLQERLRRLGPLSLAQAVFIVRQAAEGLAAIHAAGVLHRDMKASNIMLCAGESDDAPRAVLLDFGIAREFDETRAALTGDQHVIGTLDYLAPEQLQGEPWCPTSDLYALGVVFFQALVGRVPGGELSVWERTAARAGQSTIPAADLNRLPESARAIVGACLAPQAERVQSAAELLALLDSLYAESAQTAWTPVKRSVSVLRFGLLALGVVVFALMLLWFAGYLGRIEGTSARKFPVSTSAVSPTRATFPATRVPKREEEVASEAQSPAESTQAPQPNAGRHAAPSTVPPKQVRKNGTTRQPVTGASEANCSPPYYYREGLRVYRPECL